MERYCAASLFQPSNLRGAVEDTMRSDEGSRYLFGCAMSFPHTAVARTIAPLGYDLVLIDAEHTAIDPENLVQLIYTINFCSEGRSAAVVRVPSAHSDFLTYALDAGAAGIILPHIDNAAMAAEAVRKCRYGHPGGERSLAPFALTAGVTDITPQGEGHHAVANAHVAIICQIESACALDNIDSIAAAPGATCLMLGPSDLRLDLGLPIRGRTEPQFLAAIEQMIEASHRHRMPLMTTTFKASLCEDGWLKAFSVHIIAADADQVVRGFQKSLKDTKGALICSTYQNGTK